jgi:agmatine deiminase
LGYRFPAEWAPQAATWLSWPRPEGISFPDRYDRIGPNLAAIVAEIARRQAVHINVPNAAWETKVRQQLAADMATLGYEPPLLEKVRFFHIPTNESWCRDHGPAFLVQAGEPNVIVDWKFNAWGGKYPPWDADDAVPTHIGEALGLKVFDAPIIMEGGAVDFDGNGTILTTTDCLLNENRNPGVSKQQIEQHLLDYYGQRQVCWLTGGIEGDDTDGHVDDLARFVNESTIVLGVEEDPSDPNHAVTVDAVKQARALRNADGRPYEVVEIPMPGVVEIEDQRVPATYVNFLFVNGALLVPTFGVPNDRPALEALQRLLPNHEVVGIDCRELIWGLGAIHCLTQQQPAP